MKIIGLMVTWNNLEFFKCALEQALSFCDEVIVVEGCHSQQYPKYSTDGTCEYIESIKGMPKLRVMDFDFIGRYDTVVRRIRQDFPKTSKFYKPGNWVAQWDDDTFFLEEDLPKLKVAMEKTKNDAVTYPYRNFFYNFRFNFLADRQNGVYYRITDGLHLAGISKARYKDKRPYSCQVLEGMMCFHYAHVKKPERQNARFVMSVEKGTKASVGRYEKWLSVSWNKDEDIFNSLGILRPLRPVEEPLSIYNGKHPMALDSHPWRHIKDVREVK